MTTVKCGNASTFHPGKTCARPDYGHGHLGLHRDTPRLKPLGTIQWGDNEGTPRPGMRQGA